MLETLFSRLAVIQGCLLALVVGILGLGVGILIVPEDMIGELLILVLIAEATGVALTVLVSHKAAKRVSQPLGELVGVVDQLGQATSPVFPDADEQTQHLAMALNRQGELLARRISQLEEDRQQLRTILSGMVEGVIALSADQRVLYANDRAIKLLNLPGSQLVGRPLWEVIRQRVVLDLVQRALDRPQPQLEEIGWNGREPRHLTIHAARLPGDPPRGAVLVFHDTTDLRRLERLRQEFVANVSHELKTPLSVIKACVETLLDGAVDDAAHRGSFLKQIADQADRLHTLIIDMLSLARIESGDEMFDLTDVDLQAVVLGCLSRYQTRAEARQQKLELVSSAPENEEPSLTVWADEEAVCQILDNLLDNALKYTPDAGTIQIACRREGNEVVLEVADTGIGIPQADLPRVFERFYRVDKARSRQMGGTGLGLSIVKHLAQGMQGNVRAVSRLGEGSKFIVTLPSAGPSEASPSGPVSGNSLLSSS